MEYILEGSIGAVSHIDRGVSHFERGYGVLLGVNRKKAPRFHFDRAGVPPYFILDEES